MDPVRDAVPLEEFPRAVRGHVIDDVEVGVPKAVAVIGYPVADDIILVLDHGKYF